VSVVTETIERNQVLMAHGGGGEMTGRLVAEHLLPRLKNEYLAPLTDGAVLDWTAPNVVFTTDSYVVTPLVFPGGDIGRLAVCGTVNDLAVMGAVPVALSLGLIMEEGLPIDTLDRITQSIAAAAREAGVNVVTGDTKVIERRGGPGLFINTAGIGRLRGDVRLDIARVEPGDAIIVNGRIAEHGLAIMSVRAGLEFNSDLRSDAAPLGGLLAELFDEGVEVKFLRDATRGGLAGVFADLSERSECTLEIDERSVPISRTARHAAEMLGLDPLTVANEGKVVCVVAGRDAQYAVHRLRRHPLGRAASIIGRVTDAQPPLVELITAAGGRRIVQRPYGEELPRIC
jgi:hydrogenase expression/formation protein HypE